MRHVTLKALGDRGVGYADTPGIWSQEQVEAWSKVTQAVHEKDGKIVLQLWHVGRISDPSFLDGKKPVAPSAIAAQGEVSLLRPKRPYPEPRALTTEEVAEVVEQSDAFYHTTLAAFDEPGDYVLRVQVVDWDLGNAFGFHCCWTNRYVKVMVSR